MEYVLLITIGLIAGALGSLIGVGGGFIVIPVLLLGFAYPHTWAAATSLAFIFFNSLASSLNYAGQKRIDFRTGVPFALSTIPGAWLGASLTPYLNAATFNTVFGLLLIMISLFMFFRPEGSIRDRSPAWLGKKITRRFTDARGVDYEYSFSLNLGLLISFGVGFLSSILGIGGGIVHIPAMTMLLGIPPHIATATSMFILTISTFVGATAHLVQGNVQLIPALFLAIGAVTGAQIGTRLAPLIHGRWLLRIFALVMGGIGLELLLK
ncbi:MAG: sulfite exporter TauE/SafE family protein [Heliobacteriaceae bacterium]|nr:sulfite exporter TauE/SafE family protein [Heliobacteriaceae bacterium]